MADLDLDAIAGWIDRARKDDQPRTPGTRPIVWLPCNDADDLVAAVRWAQDAPHHDACTEGYGPDGDGPHPCTCGRDEALAPFGDDQ